MKQRLQKQQKNFLKIGYLFLMVSLLFVSCKEDTFNDTSETIKEERIKRITLNELKPKIGNTETYESLSQNFDVNKKIELIILKI